MSSSKEKKAERQSREVTGFLSSVCRVMCGNVKMGRRQGEEHQALAQQRSPSTFNLVSHMCDKCLGAGEHWKKQRGKQRMINTI